MDTEELICLWVSAAQACAIHSVGGQGRILVPRARLALGGPDSVMKKIKLYTWLALAIGRINSSSRLLPLTVLPPSCL